MGLGPARRNYAEEVTLKQARSSLVFRLVRHTEGGLGEALLDVVAPVARAQAEFGPLRREILAR